MMLLFFTHLISIGVFATLLFLALGALLFSYHSRKSERIRASVLATLLTMFMLTISVLNFITVKNLKDQLAPKNNEPHSSFIQALTSNK